MKHTHFYHGIYSIVQVEENLVSDTVANDFKQIVYDLIDKGDKHIVIECSKMDFIGSAGVGKLLLAYKRIKDLGGTISLVALQPEVKDLFIAFKLQEFFQILDSVNDLK